MAASKGSRPRVDDAEVDAPLQAVLLADSFEQKFRPITLDRPKVLLPLVNTPLLDYTLEWLASAGVEEVFVFCCSYAKHVVAHIESSRWRSVGNFRITAIVSHNCMSVGDALRTIDGKAVITGDFILIRGDTVANFSLTEALEEHRTRRKKEKQAVMTMLMTKCKSSKTTRQTRIGSDQLLVVFDSDSKQLLLYDNTLPPSSSSLIDSVAAKRSRCIRVDSGALKHRSSVQFRTDLIDCFIDICAPEVLHLFTDNFDYQTLRKDFVKGLLSDEVMGNQVHVHELSEESYGARVDSLRAYDAVSRDVISRWAYPLVPDTWRYGSYATSTGRMGNCHVYKEPNGVLVARSAAVGPNVVIGEGSSIGQGSVVRNSVIGRHCIIGSNVRIDGSYLWSGVSVGDGVEIKQAVLCDGVVVKERAVIEHGVVLSFNVIIGVAHRVSRYSRISLRAQKEDEDEEEEEGEGGDNDVEWSVGRRAAAERTFGSWEGAGSVKSQTGSHIGDAGYDEAGVCSVGSFDRDIEGMGEWLKEDVGVGGKGLKWRPKLGRQDEEDWRQLMGAVPKEKLGEMIERARLENELERREDDAWKMSPVMGYEDGGDTRAGKKNDEDDNDEDDDEEEDEGGGEKGEFSKEVVETVKRIAAEGVKMEDANLEIMALKLAYNKEFADCAGGVLKAMLDLAMAVPYSRPSELLDSLKKTMKKLGWLLKKFLKNMDDEVELLLALEEACMEGQEGRGRKVFAPLFANILETLYDQELVREESVLTWDEEKKGAAEADRIFARQCEAFLKWLREAAEETDDDEDDGDGEQV